MSTAISFVIDGKECDDSTVASSSTRRSLMMPDIIDNPIASSIRDDRNRPNVELEQEVILSLPPTMEQEIGSGSLIESETKEVDIIEKAKRLGFDPLSVVHGPKIYACKEIYYQGHACTAASIEQATNIIYFLAQKYDSDDCMPYAIRLVEGEELLAIAQDNGDFMSGSIVANALKRLDGYNVVLCVTRYVKGFFVAEMVQAHKRGAIKQAAEKAADMLLGTLRGARP